MFRKIRVILLLLVLATVAQSAWLARSRATDWRSSLQVVIYPLSADGSAATGIYVRQLAERHFEDIETFIAEQAERYGIATLRPADLSVAPVMDALPPPPPQGGGPLEAMAWSLHMRWWAWRNDSYRGPKPQVKLFVLYHDIDLSDRVPHSVGMDKGMIGVVNAFAATDLAPQNNVIIAHELLHTLGASDKYDPATNQPRHPEGYADPQRQPLHPQDKAEIMGGRIPLSDRHALIPPSLAEVVVGPATAREIRWLRN
jgi:hypothetical protein